MAKVYDVELMGPQNLPCTVCGRTLLHRRASAEHKFQLRTYITSPEDPITPNIVLCGKRENIHLEDEELPAYMFCRDLYAPATTHCPIFNEDPGMDPVAAATISQHFPEHIVRRWHNAHLIGVWSIVFPDKYYNKLIRRHNEALRLVLCNVTHPVLANDIMLNLIVEYTFLTKIEDKENHFALLDFEQEGDFIRLRNEDTSDEELQLPALELQEDFMHLVTREHPPRF